VADLIVVRNGEWEKAAAPAACCEPDCGPATCAPAARGEQTERSVAEESCCEPECGPETCPGG